MNNDYVFDDEELCYMDDAGNIVYCSAGGCEAPASELVGESRLPLCGVCADIWYMGFYAGEGSAK